MNKLNEYSSITEAAKMNKTDNSSIGFCCRGGYRGRYKTVKGFIYRYAD